MIVFFIQLVSISPAPPQRLFTSFNLQILNKLDPLQRASSAKLRLRRVLTPVEKSELILFLSKYKGKTNKIETKYHPELLLAQFAILLDWAVDLITVR